MIFCFSVYRPEVFDYLSNKVVFVGTPKSKQIVMLVNLGMHI